MLAFAFGWRLRVFFGSLHWKKNKRTSSLVIEVDDAKMANTLIEEGLVLDHTLNGCMRYNPASRIKQCFNCYEYGHVSVYCQKNTKCGAFSGPYGTSECPWDKGQKCPLCNGTHTSWDKGCEYRKKEYFKIETAKQNTLRLHEVRSKVTPLRRENSRDKRPPPRPQQRSQSVNPSPQA